MEIGQKVRLTKNIIDRATGDHPALRYGTKGDLVIIKDIAPHFSYTVAHEGSLCSFMVNPEEIEEWKDDILPSS